MRSLGLISVLAGVALAGCGDDSAKGPDRGLADGGTLDVGTLDVGDVDLQVDAPLPDRGATSSDASVGATIFCDRYKSQCGFGTTGHYADMATCLKRYDSYSLSRRICVGTELGRNNCTAAAGAAPCDKN
jgi:hypothetical protein